MQSRFNEVAILRRNGMTWTDVMVAVGIVAGLVAVALPVLGSMRREARKANNAMQLRGVHQGMVVWTQSSKRGPPWQTFSFPGLQWDAERTPEPNGPGTGYSGDGTHPAARLWLMMEGNFFTPEYVISPIDTARTPLPYLDHSATPTVKYHHYSYAMLNLTGTENERAEWGETLNKAAVVLSDRAIGSGVADIESLWTRAGGGEAGRWEGHIVKNDNHVQWGDRSTGLSTQYGGGVLNGDDDLFADDAAADDGFLVHRDEVTAYSAD
jgi:hypothetical protein